MGSRPGASGGRGQKKVHILSPEGLDRAFLAIVGEHTAGDLIREQVRWTNLGARQIVQRLLEAGYAVSRNIVRQPSNSRVTANARHKSHSQWTGIPTKTGSLKTSHA